MPSPSAAEHGAAQLLRARSTRRPIPLSDMAELEGVEAAMRVQFLVQRQLDRPVRGWKIALSPNDTGAVAPLLDIVPDGAVLDLYPRCEIEVEIAVSLKADIPVRSSGKFSRDDIVGNIQDAYLGIEIIESRYREADIPFLPLLADNLGNHSYVVGPPLPLAILDELDGTGCRVTLDDAILHEAPARHPRHDPLLSLVEYANNQTDFLGGLTRGQILTTGSFSGVIPVGKPGTVRVTLADHARMSVTFV